MGTFGAGRYTFEVVPNWFRPPKGWVFGWMAAVACDAQGRVFVYSRSEHPLVVLDRDGNFLEKWGKELLKDAHGLWIDAAGNVYCTERNRHCVFQFSPCGELLMTLGTPDKPAAEDGKPFNKPTDAVTVGASDRGAPFKQYSLRTAMATLASTDLPLTENWSSRGEEEETVLANLICPIAFALTAANKFGFATGRIGASRFLTWTATT